MSATKGNGKCYLWLVDRTGLPDGDCLIWPFYRNPNGYGQFGYLGVQRWAHRMMCELVHGVAPAGCEAAHDCGNGNKGCVHPKHIFWRTKSQNREDALRHGTGVVQRTGNKGSLTLEQVTEIRSLKGQMRQVDIAEKFGISEPRVRAIFTNKIYRADRKIRNWSEGDDIVLRRAAEEGRPFSTVAKLIGASHGSVYARASRLGLRSTSPVAIKRFGPLPRSPEGVS